MPQSCATYHFKGNFVWIQDLLVSPIFKYLTFDLFRQVGSQLQIDDNCNLSDLLHIVYHTIQPQRKIHIN